MPMEAAQKTDDEMAAEILDMLDGWDTWMNGHLNRRRERPRFRFRTQVTVQIPEPGDSRHVPQQATCLNIWARNLSQAGMSFLYRGNIDSQQIIVCLDADSGSHYRCLAKIVRSRDLRDDFREYGAVFLSRVET